MFVYSKFENISLYLTKILNIFVTEQKDSFLRFSALIFLPNIYNNNSLRAYDSKENFSYYLSGLIEGDGSFNVPKFLKDSSGKKRVAGIEVIGNIKDKPAFEFFRNKLGGNIYLTKGNSVRWNIKD